MDLNELSNEILFNRYQGGQAEAFDILIERHQRLVYSLILRYISNRAEADEVFQDVFLKICKKKDQFREAVSFKSWMMTIARNTCIDRLRKNKKHQKDQSFDEDPEHNHGLSETLAADQTSPLDHVTHQMEDQNLKGLLDELPEEQRTTFYSKIVMDMTFEEIAAAMGVSVNTAKSRHRYALKALRKLVNRQRMMQSA